MGAYEHELRLAWAVVLNAVPLLAAWRFVSRRIGGGRLGRAVDAGLLFYLVQYVTIGALGLAGALTPVTITALAALLSAALGVAGGRSTRPVRPVNPPPPAPASALDHALVIACGLFVVGYVGGVVHNQRFLPPMANDALTYHLPAAVHWLQTWRLGLFETWFYNPANTYSPLAGSTFLAWLIAPTGNDVLARFAQVGPLLLTFAALADLCRRLGARLGPAAVVAAAAVVSRPLVSQVALAKDDAFIAAFFVVAVAAMARDRLEQRRWGALRVGTAVGLFLAVKYTALLSAPLLVLAIDAPFRARWTLRRWVAAVGVVALLAGPWFARNAVLTGNPLYPTDVRVGERTVFEGLFTPLRSDRLQGWGEWDVSIVGGAELSVPVPRAWLVFVQGYYGVPAPLAALLILGWGTALVARFRDVLRDPLVRVTVVGPVVGIALFVATSPYAEMRFTYPSLLLLFACAAAGTARWPRAGLAACGAVLLAAVATSYVSDRAGDIVTFTAAGLVAAGVGLAGWFLARRGRAALLRVGAGLSVATAALLLVYIYWPGYVRQTEEVTTSEAPPAARAWEVRYGDVFAAWDFVRTKLPAAEPLAYANAYLVYPLQGFGHDRPLVYAPTRPGVRHIHDLPHFPEPVIGEYLPAQVVAVTTADPDPDTWLANLAATGAGHLFVGKQDVAEPSRPADPVPPELTLARRRPDRFVPVFENDAAVVFRIVR